MSKFAACIVATTASLFVLEGCKDAADKAIDNMNKATKDLNKKAGETHKIADCTKIISDLNAEQEKLAEKNKDKKPKEASESELKKLAKATEDLAAAEESCMTKASDAPGN